MTECTVESWAYSVCKSARPVKYRPLCSSLDSTTHRNDEVGQWWEFRSKFVDPALQVCSGLSSESRSLFEKQNKNK